MNDYDILRQLVAKIKSDNSITSIAQDMYTRLAAKVTEDGFEIILADKSLSESDEDALRELSKHGYIKLDYRHQALGWCYIVELRGCKFLDAQNSTCESNSCDIFATSAIRDSSDSKSRMDLISPFALEKLGDLLASGAKKYGERNWEQGISISRHLQSLYRHLINFQQGKTDEDHLTSIFCNTMFMIHTVELVKRGLLPDSLLDIPNYNLPRVHYNNDEAYSY
jgi:hypothetical protein